MPSCSCLPDGERLRVAIMLSPSRLPARRQLVELERLELPVPLVARGCFLEPLFIDVDPESRRVRYPPVRALAQRGVRYILGHVGGGLLVAADNRRESEHHLMSSGGGDRQLPVRVLADCRAAPAGQRAKELEAAQ